MTSAKISELMSRIKATGDESALQELFGVTHSYSRYLCRKKYPRIDGYNDDDKEQAIQIALWQAALKFDPARCEHGGAAYRYTHRIMERAIINLLKESTAQRRRILYRAGTLTEFLQETIPDPRSCADDNMAFADDDRARVVRNYLESDWVTPPERMVLENYTADDGGDYIATAATIKRRLGVSVSVKFVDNALMRVKAKLRRHRLAPKVRDTLGGRGQNLVPHVTSNRRHEVGRHGISDALHAVVQRINETE